MQTTQAVGFCTKCGAQNDHDNKFCFSCGAALPWFTATAPISAPAKIAPPNTVHSGNSSFGGTVSGVAGPKYPGVRSFEFKRADIKPDIRDEKSFRTSILKGTIGGLIGCFAAGLFFSYIFEAGPMTMLWVVSAFTILGGILGMEATRLNLITASRNSVLQALVEKKLADERSFTPTACYFSNTTSNGYSLSLPSISVDNKTNQGCVVAFDTLLVTAVVFNAMDLMQVEIVQDGETVTSTQSGSLASRALIGGAAFGGAGAVVGALTAKTRSKTQIVDISLKILVNDMSAPSHTVSFLQKAVPRGSQAHTAALKQCEHWHGILRIMMQNG